MPHAALAVSPDRLTALLASLPGPALLLAHQRVEGATGLFAAAIEAGAAEGMGATAAIAEALAPDAPARRVTLEAFLSRPAFGAYEGLSWSPIDEDVWLLCLGL